MAGTCDPMLLRAMQIVLGGIPLQMVLGLTGWQPSDNEKAHLSGCGGRLHSLLNRSSSKNQLFQTESVLFLPMPLAVVWVFRWTCLFPQFPLSSHL